MRPAAIVVLSCVLIGGCVHDALLPDVRGPEDDFPGSPRPVPRDSTVAREIAAGYATYGAELAAWGEWSQDPLYGVLWCPRGVDGQTFAPYRWKGHWAASEDPTGAPRWVVDDGSRWGEVTMHHGWWVSVRDHRGSGDWCWVPGVAATPARVVWRSADGYVGWAPEPPVSDIDDEGSDDDDLFSWVFELTGTLLEDVLDDYLLTGDAADAADEATRRARSQQRHSGGRPSRLGPPRSDVTAARTALSEYLAAHPTVGTTTSGGSSTGSIAVRLPRGTSIYQQMTRDPLYETVTGSRSTLPALPRGGSHSGGSGWSLSGPSSHEGSSSSSRSTTSARGSYEHSGGGSSSGSSSHSSGGSSGHSSSSSSSRGGHSGDGCGSSSSHHK